MGRKRKRFPGLSLVPLKVEGTSLVHKEPHWWVMPMVMAHGEPFKSPRKRKWGCHERFMPLRVWDEMSPDIPFNPPSLWDWTAARPLFKQ